MAGVTGAARDRAAATAHRDADQGVPAGGLRRRGRARGVPGQVASGPGRPDGALPGRGPGGRDRAPAMGSAGRRELCASGDLDGPVDDGGGRRRRPRPLAHLVREPGRPPELAAVRHPARADRAFAGAAATVEGRATRRRLCAVELVRANGDAVSVSRHRRVQRHGGRHPRFLPGRYLPIACT